MSFKISNVVNRGSVRWIVLAVFMVGAISGATGIAAAQLDGTETEFYNETTPITNDTTDLELTINGTGGDHVYANVYRIADDSVSTETLVSEDVRLSSPSNETVNTTHQVQTNNTAAYRVVIHDNNDQYTATASQIGNITATSFPLDSGGVDSGGDTLDGGGVGLIGDSGNPPMIGILLGIVILVLLWVRE
jgi:hypothetical protein